MAFFSDSRSDAPACTLPRALLDDLNLDAPSEGGVTEVSRSNG